LGALSAGVGSFALGQPFMLPHVSLLEEKEDYDEDEDEDTAVDSDVMKMVFEVESDPSVLSNNTNTTTISVVNRDGSESKITTSTLTPIPSVSPTSPPSPLVTIHGHSLPRIMAIDKFSSLSMVSILHRSEQPICAPDVDSDGNSDSALSPTTKGTGAASVEPSTASCALLVGFTNLEPFAFGSVADGADDSSVPGSSKYAGQQNDTVKIWYDYFTVGLYVRSIFNCTTLSLSGGDSHSSLIRARKNLSVLNQSTWKEGYPELSFESSIQNAISTDRSDSSSPADVVNDNPIIARVHFHRVGAQPRPPVVPVDDDSVTVDEDESSEAHDNFGNDTAAQATATGETAKFVGAIVVDDVVDDTDAKDDDVGQEEIEIDDADDAVADDAKAAKKLKHERFLDEYVDGPISLGLIMVAVALIFKYWTELKSSLRRCLRREQGYIPIRND
jgi:hypothetical protein